MLCYVYISKNAVWRSQNRQVSQRITIREGKTCRFISISNQFLLQIIFRSSEELSPTEAPRTVKTVASPTSAAVSAMKLLSCSRVARGKLQMIDGITWDF